MDDRASTGPDARQVRSRRSLHEALLRLIETRPFDQITIREIAADAGIGYATFFRHYPAKESLLHDVAAGEIAGLLARLVPMLFVDASRASCAALFEHVGRHRALWSALLTGGAAATLKEEFTRQARGIADAAGRDGARTGGAIPDELHVVVAVGATVEILAWWLRDGAGHDVAQMADVLDRLVVTPAIAPD